ncbi:MAG: radical SAM protein [Candidatus Sumerlaeaceae bacterium]|nr:radical SAM protein [Candidatus Sumerlaeaceae bacterium]
MSLRTTLSRALDRFEAGREFKARLRAAMAGEAPAPSRRHEYPFDLLRYIHVEGSFLCNLECRMCPRLVEGHAEGLMPFERFSRLFPIFPYLDYVVLTGYGEPTLNPRLPEFVAAVRSRGPRPRLTTNGTILSEEKARALLDAGIDNLHVSIDAGTKETFERVRAGARWERVLENSRRFNELRRAGGYEVGTAWAFVVMRDNFRELPEAVRHAANCGFDLVTTNFIARNALDFEQAQVLHTVEGDWAGFREEFEAVEAECRSLADRLGIQFRVLPFHLSYDGGCLSDPIHSLFVDWMGNVSPCCQLPVRSDRDRHPAHAFGNIEDQDIMEILLSRRLRVYWDNWLHRRIPAVCKNCYQVVRLPERDTYTDAVEN